MATLTQMASSTALDVSHANASIYRGKTTEQKANSTTKRIRDTKYRHVFATHAVTRTSCLSQDAETSPSFVGFRNLMILVLSTHSSLPRYRKWLTSAVISNLRLMIENLQKVCFPYLNCNFHTN